MRCYRNPQFFDDLFTPGVPAVCRIEFGLEGVRAEVWRFCGEYIAKRDYWYSQAEWPEAEVPARFQLIPEEVTT